MKLGIIGAGAIGGTVGALWAKAGHHVRFGTRNPTGLRELIASIGENAAAGTVAEAAEFGEVVFTAVPYGSWPELAVTLEPLVRNKVVIDAANPYPLRDGAFARDTLAKGEGSGMPIARLLPGAKVIRGFNTVYYKTLQSEAHRSGARVGIPLAGDDAAALELASGLVRDAGFEPVVVGSLARARDFDVGAPCYNTGMSGEELARAFGTPRHE